MFWSREKNSDGMISSSVLRKPTHTNLYLKENSYHPASIKQGIIKTMFDMCIVICDKDNQEREMNYIKLIFKRNGYNKTKINRSLQKACRKKPKKEEKKEMKRISIPYVRGLSEKIEKSLSKYDIKVALTKLPGRLNLFYAMEKIKYRNVKGKELFIKVIANAESHISVKRGAP